MGSSPVADSVRYAQWQVPARYRSPLRRTWFRSERRGDVRVLGDMPARRISRTTGVETGIELYHRSNTPYRVTVLLPWMYRPVRIDVFVP